MKPNTLFSLSAAAVAVLATGVAFADGISPATGHPAADPVAYQATEAHGPAVYEGTDAQGRLVRLTIADVGVQTLVRVSSNGQPVHYPQPHWSSLIGTGQAASLER